MKGNWKIKGKMGGKVGELQTKALATLCFQN